MAVIPPWISVSPRDFLQAAQAGANIGLQLGSLRQRGAMEQARLAQAAAEAEANRDAAEARANRAFEMQRWEREMMDRARSAELAQREKASELATSISLARLEAEKAHYKEMEQRDADKVKAQLNLPTRLHIGTIGDSVVGTDPYTGESKVLYTSPAKEKAAKPSGVTVHGLPLNLSDKSLGTLSGPLDNPMILQKMGTNAPGFLRPSGGFKVLSIERE